MRGQSSTTLPARCVEFACGKALNEIREQRAMLKCTVKEDWIENYKLAHPVKSIFTRPSDMIDMIPPEVYAIADQYRESDDAVLSALHSLSMAAMDAGKNFTVVITADDFRLIQKFYKGDNDGRMGDDGAGYIPMGRAMGGMARVSSAAPQANRTDVGSARRFHVAPLAVVDYPPPPRPQAGASFSSVARVRGDDALRSRRNSRSQASEEGEQYNE